MKNFKSFSFLGLFFLIAFIFLSVFPVNSIQIFNINNNKNNYFYYDFLNSKIEINELTDKKGLQINYNEIIKNIPKITPSAPNQVGQNSYFGRALTDGIYFYSSPINEESYKQFQIPQSFFVELISNAGDIENLFYSAKYMDKTGYVKKTDVQVVSGTPQTPYANALSFRVFVPNGLELRSTPSTATPFNIVTTIPYLETSLIYYGSIFGEEMISQKGNEWYYCKYIYGTNKYWGYLYSGLCDLLPKIPINTENLSPLNEEIFSTHFEETSNEISVKPNLTKELKIVLIIAICIPCLFIIYLLFKPTKLVVDNGEKGKKKIKRLRKSEYYELDD